MSTSGAPVLETWIDDIRVGFMPVSRSTPLTGRRLSDNKSVNLGEIGTFLDKTRAIAKALKEMEQDKPSEQPSHSPDEKQWKEECLRLERQVHELQDELKASKSAALATEAESLRIVEKINKDEIKAKDDRILEFEQIAQYHEVGCAELGKEVESLKSQLADAEALASRRLEDKVALEKKLESAISRNRDQETEINDLRLQIQSLKNASENGSYNSIQDDRVAKIEREASEIKGVLRTLGLALQSLCN